ncbi:MAG: hypothetical protein H6584_03485 [Flavobacteriales bacterium]|nr:hypothetical protein [Flavobacteriales bacterium]
MKNSAIFLIIILTLLISACNQKKESKTTIISYPATIEDYLHNKFHHSVSSKLRIETKDSIAKYLFITKESSDTLEIVEMPFEINLNNPNEILIDTTSAKLIAQKNYTLKNKQLVVYKYFFDEPASADEEGFFFISENRIIAFNSLAWNLIKLFKYGGAQTTDLLVKDTTDFFYLHDVKTLQK